MHPRIAKVTERIRERSRPTRGAYLAMIEAAQRQGPARTRLSCANLAHGFAGCDPLDKTLLREGHVPNIGIVTSYNDMLSAHRPFETYPEVIREAVRQVGSTAQVAGGVPAMCDGVTQGRVGMELSLFSRDVIAQATAIALCHDMFDAALCLGICDKIVPGLLIGALAFGHLPTVFVPGGPMPSGIPNRTKAEVRERYAAGEATRDELLSVEADSYHSPGTCTFYGTANSNQIMLEAMGLQLPGTSFVNPGTPLREALTRAAAQHAVAISGVSNDYRPIGRLVDERAIVNAIVALVATGGSTNHTIHWVAVARAAGIVINWDDYDAISKAVPLIARIYPNGEADVNRFHAAGGIAFVFRELLDGRLMHDDIETIVPGGLRAYTRDVCLQDGAIDYVPATTSGDPDVVRPLSNPFEASGGLRLLTGNIGRALAKVSAVKPEHRRVEAPAVVVDDPQQLRQLHKENRLPRDFVAVVRYQGPRANGMPEMHILTPILGMLQNQGRRVALVTDGRLSGASGKVPSAIHVTPEAAMQGAIARVRDGDRILLDSDAGVLKVQIDDREWQKRELATNTAPAGPDRGRLLFAHNRTQASGAESGALSINAWMPPGVIEDKPPANSEYDLGPGNAFAPFETRDQ